MRMVLARHTVRIPGEYAKRPLYAAAESQIHDTAQHD